jgi:hypothetical protein
VDQEITVIQLLNFTLYKIGVTISSAAFLNKQRPLSLENINEWQDVRILIVDEVSFMSDKHIVTLDTKLKLIGDRNKPYGGFSIVFAGDFRQLPPVGATEFELIYSSKSNGLVVFYRVITG